MKNKKISILKLIIVTFLFYCCSDNSKKNNGDNSNHGDSISINIPKADNQIDALEDTLSRVITNESQSKKMFQDKISITSGDSIISYKVVKSKEKNCVNWVIPAKNNLITIISSFYQITGNEWHDCYGDWYCGVEGEIIYHSKKYNYRFDASGWILLYNKKEQIYFGCKSPECKKHFPTDCFCDENGMIDE